MLVVLLFLFLFIFFTIDLQCSSRVGHNIFELFHMSTLFVRLCVNEFMLSMRKHLLDFHVRRVFDELFLHLVLTSQLPPPPSSVCVFCVLQFWFSQFFFSPFSTRVRGCCLLYVYTLPNFQWENNISKHTQTWQQNWMRRTAIHRVSVCFPNENIIFKNICLRNKWNCWSEKECTRRKSWNACTKYRTGKLQQQQKGRTKLCVIPTYIYS